MSKAPLPIVLLHHNQPESLLRCAKAIVENTKRPYKLFVVDNASPASSEVDAILGTISQRFSGIVIRNTSNNWILGFNCALRHPDWPHGADFYVFSDADVIVPRLSGPAGTCWLSYLEEQMNTHACIGKLGLTLALDNLRSNPELLLTCRREERYLAGPRIGSNVIAPVDSTMAIYRKDLFVARFKFRVGHASLVKPHYYTCRTAADVSCKHIGWDYYPGGQSMTNDPQGLWKKAWCMARFAAYLDPAVFKRLSFRDRSALRIISFAARIYFGCIVTFLVFLYFAPRFPRAVNEIQARVR